MRALFGTVPNSGMIKDYFKLIRGYKELFQIRAEKRDTTKLGPFK